MSGRQLESLEFWKGGPGGFLPKANRQLRELDRRTRDEPRMLRQVVRPGKDIGFWAKIAGSTSLGNNRWSYTYQEVQLQPAGVFQPLSGGRSGTAYNTAEAFNAAAGVLGNGDNTANFPGGIALQPIGPAVIWLRLQTDCNGDAEYVFTAMNSSGGSC